MKIFTRCPNCGKRAHKSKLDLTKKKFVCRHCNNIFKLKGIFDYVKGDKIGK